MNDYALGATIYLMFTTRAFSTGVPTVLAGSQTVEIYENDNATPIVEGASKLVLSVSWQSIVGLNLATITATTGNGFESGKEYHLIIKTGTVGGVSVVGEVVGHFSIEKSSATLKIGAPTDLGGGATVAFNLSDIEAQTDDIGAAGAGLSAIPTIATVTNLTNAPTNGDLTATMKTSVTTAASSSTPAVTVSDKTGFALSTAGILAIWHQLTSAIVTASTIGKLIVDNLNATITSRGTSTLTQTQVTGGAYDVQSASCVLGDARLAELAAANLPADIDAILADTNELQVDDYPTSIAAVKADTAAILLDTAEIGTAGAGLTAADDAVISAIAALNNLSAAAVNAEVDAALATVATESYAADNAAATPIQLLYMIWSLLAEANVATTTLTAKKLDGATTAMTFTLSDATNPVSITRAT